MRLGVFESKVRDSICMSFSEALAPESRDKEGLRVAGEIKEFLEHAGWDVWYSKESVAGVMWDTQWKQRAQMALACIICLSRTWLESDACAIECAFLAENNIHTIVVVVDENYREADDWDAKKDEIKGFGNWATRKSYKSMEKGIVFGNIERALIYHKYCRQ